MRSKLNIVIPELAKPKRASVWQRRFIGNPEKFLIWIPACAGMTKVRGSRAS
jgi:hypothetical protein